MPLQNPNFLVMICAGTEWRSILPFFTDARLSNTAYGDYFSYPIGSNQVNFYHSGWGKVAASGATQYVIDRWNPDLLVNLGTCGGVEGLVKLHDTLLAEETVIYDVIEGMSGYQQAITHYSSKANLDWLGADLPFKVKRCKLFSADRDIRPEDVKGILREFGAAAADWESGAFAWICNKNRKDWLVIRCVTDLVNETQGEALGNADLWRSRTKQIMQSLLNTLPWIFDQYQNTH